MKCCFRQRNPFKTMEIFFNSSIPLSLFCSTRAAKFHRRGWKAWQCLWRMLESGITLHFPHLFWTQGLQIFSVRVMTVPSKLQKMCLAQEAILLNYVMIAQQYLRLTNKVIASTSSWTFKQVWLGLDKKKFKTTSILKVQSHFKARNNSKENLYMLDWLSYFNPY